MSKEIGDALYASVITDTGSFRYEATNSDTHIMAAHLLNNGVKPYGIHKAIYEQRPQQQVMLLGKVINNLKFSDDGSICWYIITIPYIVLMGFGSFFIKYIGWKGQKISN